MIFGLGTDIIEIARLKKAVERQGERFLQKIFTSRELNYCLKFSDPYARLAARFAAKEALLKAAGTGLIGAITWHDMEIVHDERGQPQVVLSGALAEMLVGMRVHVSLSHCKAYATATAVIETRL